MGRGLPCYFGCGNTGNKIVWAAFAVSAALGAGLIIGGSASGYDCFQGFQECRNNGGSQDFCQRLYNNVCNLSKYQGLLGSGIIIFFVITPLLTTYFCCCATRPNTGDQQEVVLVASVPGPGPAPYHMPPPGYMPYPPQGYPPQGAYPYPGGQPPPGMGYPMPPPPGQGYPAPGPSAVPPVVEGTPYPPVNKM